MKFLVDANVLSEPTKPQSVQRVELWLDANAADLAVDAVVMGEIWRGVDALPDGRKKQGLIEWFERLRRNVHCLPWTIETALAWGELVNRVRRAGFTVGTRDTMIAATRNVEDFARCGVPVVNPFE